MGDRVNIIVADVSSLEGIAIYSHWGGHRIPQTVARFISKTTRFDIDYFTRNLVMNIVADGFVDFETGKRGFDLLDDLEEQELREFAQGFKDELSYGISLWLAGDREYPILILDPTDRMIYLSDDYSILTIKEAIARASASVSFDTFKEVKSWSEAKELFKAERSLEWV